MDQTEKFNQLDQEKSISLTQKKPVSHIRKKIQLNTQLDIMKKLPKMLKNSSLLMDFNQVVLKEL